jgi:lipoyl(octanoyl) transferase
VSIKKKLFHSSKTLDFFKLGTNSYEMILSLMANFTSSRDQLSRDEIWIMEHFPIYTIGFKKKHPNENLPFKIIETDRGGDITFHGLGQIVFYTLINLKRRKIFIKNYVRLIENVIICFLAYLKIDARRIEGKPGVYVNKKKIASIGLKYTRGFLYHGFSFNYKINFNHWSFINPCGYQNLKVIDLYSLNNKVSYDNTVNYLVKIFTDLLENHGKKF